LTQQSDILNKVNQKPRKEYTFFIKNPSKGEPIELQTTPVGWMNGSLVLSRNKKYKGVFRKISVDEITLQKNAVDFVIDVFDTQTVDGEINFLAKQLNTDTYSYDKYFEGKLDLSILLIEDVGVTTNLLDTSFTEKIKNRESIKVDVFDLVSIGGYNIVPFDNENNFRLILPEFELTPEASWKLSQSAIAKSLDHVVPIELTKTDFLEAVTPNFNNPIGSIDTKFIDQAEDDRTYNININIASTLTNTGEDKERVRWQIKEYDQSNILVDTTTIHTSEFVQPSKTISDEFSYSRAFGVSAGYTLEISCLTESVISVDHNSIEVYSTYVDITLPQTSIVSFPINELFQRICQKIADKQVAFYSDYFRRTDLGFASDGQLLNVFKGLFARGFDKTNQTFNVSLKELFNSVDAAFNLSFNIETINGDEVVRIEEESYAYSSEVALDLSSKVNESLVKREVIPDLYYNQIISGYKKFTYEELGGLKEYNTKNTYSTVIASTSKTLSLISDIRGDTQGIIKLRRHPASTEGTIDIEGDTDLFMVEVIRDGGDFKARTNEGFSLIEGGFDSGQSYNYNLTPHRNTKRHGGKIRAGLEGRLNTSLKWEGSDKNTQLITQLDTETSPVAENSNITIADLEQPLWHPFHWLYDRIALTAAEIRLLSEGSRKLVKLSNTKYGWIESAEMNQKTKKTSLRLRAANLDYVTPGAINNPPVVSSFIKPATGAYETKVPFVVGDFPYTDPDSDPAGTLIIKTTTLTGQMLLNDVILNDGDEVLISGGSFIGTLEYAAAKEEDYGFQLDGFNFSMKDDRGLESNTSFCLITLS
jgi:hypothetical protein